MHSAKKSSSVSLAGKIRAALELMRPANIVTAFADILAGAAAATGFLLLSDSDVYLFQNQIYWLLIATFGLYGGGIVFNDVFDAELDAKERPERTIPSGRVSKLFAAVLGITLFVIGNLSALQVNLTAGFVAILVTCCSLFYDAIAKHNTFFGPLFMGLCRGGNLLLGMSIYPEVLLHLWPLALIPVAYIGAITLISQGEVKGGSKLFGLIASLIVILITFGLAFLSFMNSFELVHALPSILFFGAMVIPPFIQATKQPIPKLIKKAVKRGVLSLIILNSAIAAGFAGFTIGVLVLLLLPVSIFFAKIFSVT